MTEEKTQEPSVNPRDIYLDVMGRMRTQSLFYEFKDPGYPALFTLKEEDFTDQDGTTYLSLRRLYVESLDPTEYTFSQRAFGSWRHWSRIRDLNWFAPFYTEWKTELDVRLRSIGATQLRKLAEGEATLSNPTAAKYFADGSYWPQQKKRGRPSSSEVAGERKRLALADKELDDDLQRISTQ